MKRLFIAIDLSDIQQIDTIFNQLKNQLKHEKIHWVNPKNMHITLKFLGSTPVERLKKIIETMDSVVKSSTPLKLNAEKIGIFGSRYNPRIIWLGFEKNNSLEMIAEQIKIDFSKMGYNYDRQNFVPHLTLGRIAKIEVKDYFQTIIKKYNTLNLNEITIDKIHLYESVLQKNGPEYISIKTWNL